MIASERAILQAPVEPRTNVREPQAAFRLGGCNQFCFSKLSPIPVFSWQQSVFSSKREVTLQEALFFVQYAVPQQQRSSLRSIDSEDGVISRYTIDRHTNVDRIFNVHAGNGSIFLQKPLDREDLAWHNISVIATEFSKSCTHIFTFSSVKISH